MSLFAMSSVKNLTWDIHSGETFTPVPAARQPSVRSGFPLGLSSIFPEKRSVLRSVTIERSTNSGFANADVKFVDASIRRRLANYVTSFYALNYLSPEAFAAGPAAGGIFLR